MTQETYETELTSEQRTALLEVYGRRELRETWTQFIRSAFNDPVMGCVLVPWCGMTLGIEKDGHTHS